VIQKAMKRILKHKIGPLQSL